MYLPDAANFQLAVRSVSEDRLDLLPPSVTEEAVPAYADELGEYYRGLAKNGRHLGTVPVTHGWKSTSGLRPISTMSVLQRVALRALGLDLLEHLEAPERTRDAHRAFVLAPVEAGVEYVVLTDVAAFYGFVAHDQLAMEILRRTGEEYLAETTARLLDEYMERSFGLPQTSLTSDLLSEVYIDVAHRALVRDGIEVWRFNDDFRLGASSYQAAQRALVGLAEHLDELGLALNEAKTWVMRADTYAASLQRPEEAENRIEDQAEIEADQEVWSTDDYGEPELVEEGPHEDGFVDRLTDEAVRILDLWNAATGRESGETRSRLELSKIRTFAGRAIGILGVVESSLAIQYLDALLSVEPQFAPQVSRYLSRIGGASSSAVKSWYADNAANIERLTEWQQVWLLEPLIENYGWGEEAIGQWVTGMLESSANPYVRSRAALCLAWADQVEVADLLTLYSGTPEGFRADVAAAVVARTTEELSDVSPDLARESVEVRLVAEWFHRRHFGGHVEVDF